VRSASPNFHHQPGDTLILPCEYLHATYTVGSAPSHNTARSVISVVALPFQLRH
jgi:hypothetical protein